MKKAKLKKELYFLHLKENKKQFLSVVNDTVMICQKFSNTCLYTKDELVYVAEFLEKNKVPYQPHLTTDVNKPPHGYNILIDIE